MTSHNWLLRAGYAMDKGRQKSGYEGSDDAIYKNSFRRVYVIADGMGGRRGAKAASKTACDIVGEVLSSTDTEADPDLCCANMEKGIKQANRAIYEKGKEENFQGMGTTVVAVMFRGDWMYVCHAGDSRVYRLSINNALSRLTEDHTPIDRAYRDHLLTIRDILGDSRRGVLTRYLGKEEDIDVNVTRHHLAETRKALLATDGLTDVATDREIEEILSGKEDPRITARRLVNLANHPKKIAQIASHMSRKGEQPFTEEWTEEEARDILGGQDNVSVIIIEPEYRGESNVG